MRGQTYTGYGKGRESYDDYYSYGRRPWPQSGGPRNDLWESDDCEDRFPKIAERLWELRQGLPGDAGRVYCALQQALKQHSTPHGSRPSFEKDFQENLTSQFPHAWDISTRQIGSWNQWEVQIDNSPKMYCSVRLEVLSKNSQFLHDIKSKARVVKETLLDNQGKWKLALGQEAGVNKYEKLKQFELECDQRLRDTAENNGPQPARRSSTQWQVKGTTCRICGKPKDEDQLNGTHMCVVVATFHCRDCDTSWTSYHGRLRGEDQTLMGQQCLRCRRDGHASEWRLLPRPSQEDRWGDRGNAPKGMHRCELCDACREFGNCVGIFYDPFVLTTALSLVSGRYVQWESYSKEMPELLIADLGPQYSSHQVCLQPHVYVAPREAVEGGIGGPGAGPDHPLPQAPRSCVPPPPQGERQAAHRAADPSLLQNFIRQVEDTSLGTHSSSGAFSWSVKQEPAAASQRGPSDGASTGMLEPAQAQAAQAYASAPLLAGDEAGGGPESFRAQLMEPEPVPPPPPAEKAAKANKFNKISMADQMAAKQQAVLPATPHLDGLPPMRKVQFLQIVKQHLRAAGRSEQDQYMVAEDYLSRCSGDYEKAYALMKPQQSRNTFLPVTGA